MYVPAFAARTSSVLPATDAESASVEATVRAGLVRPRLPGVSLSAMTVVASRPSLTRTVTVSPLREYWAIGVILPL